MAPSTLTAVILFAAVASASALAPIPGSTNTMDRGFDMIAGVQNSSTGPALLPVFQWTFNDGQTWTDPSDPVLSWSVPDQLTATNLDYSVQVVNDELEASFSEWITTVSESFSVSAGVTVNVNGTQAFSANGKFNHESYNYEQQMKASLKDSGYSKKFWALYSLEGLPPFLMPLSDGFKQMIAALPTSIKSAKDQKLYNQLIQYWGTHFIVKADFGGDVHLSTFVDKSLVESHSESWVANQFSLAFSFYLFNLGTSGFKNQSQIHMSSQFLSQEHTYIAFRGGNLALQSNTTIQQWIQSIPADSVYLNCTISDLSILVAPISQSKANNLQNVIKAYIKTGKLPATDDSITDYDAYYAQFDDVEVIDAPASYRPTESVLMTMPTSEFANLRGST